MENTITPVVIKRVKSKIEEFLKNTSIMKYEEIYFNPTPMDSYNCFTVTYNLTTKENTNLTPLTLVVSVWETHPYVWINLLEPPFDSSLRNSIREDMFKLINHLNSISPLQQLKSNNG